MSFFSSRISRFSNAGGILSSCGGKYFPGTNRWRTAMTLAHLMMKTADRNSSTDRIGAAWRV